MKNHKGFILPSMMVVVFFCLLIVAYISTALISDKKFYEETKQYYALENLMNIAVKASLKDIKDGEVASNNPITIHTINGYYTYSVSTSGSNIYEVLLTCRSKENKEYTASYHFDSLKNEIIFWSEY